MTSKRTQAINLLADKARRWDYVVARGCLTPKQIEEAREFAQARRRDDAK